MSNLEITYVGSLFGHSGPVTSLVVGKDSNGEPLVVSGSRDKKIVIWKLDINNPVVVKDSEGKDTEEKIVGKALKSLSGHNHFVSSLAISKDSNFLVSGSWDKTVRLWDLNTFKTKKILKGHTKDVLTVSFSPDSRLIYTGSMDNTVRVWNTEGEEKHLLTNFGGWVSCIQHTRRGKEGTNYVAVGSWDQTIKFFNSKNLEHVFSIDNFEYGVVGTQSDEENGENGDFLFSGEKNGKIRVHKITDDNVELKSTIDVNADLNAISFENKHYMAISCATSKGLIINEVNKQNKTFYKKEGSACLSLAWDQKKEYLFAGFANGSIGVIKFKSEN